VEDGKLVGIVTRANLLQGLVARGGAGEIAEDSDQEIRRKIDAALADEDWVDQNRINIVVRSGIAHLWGVVPSEDQRRALHIAVRGVPGVVGVEDHLSPDWFINDAG
jgi:osmotically-inducible protein OsmY